jgi:hypothetical protein
MRIWDAPEMAQRAPAVPRRKLNSLLGQATIS